MENLEEYRSMDFEKTIHLLGYHPAVEQTYWGKIYNIYNTNDELLLIVSIGYKYVIDTNFATFEELSIHERKELLVAALNFLGLEVCEK